MSSYSKGVVVGKCVESEGDFEKDELDPTTTWTSIHNNDLDP